MFSFVHMPSFLIFLNFGDILHMPYNLHAEHIAFCKDNSYFLYSLFASDVFK